MGGRRTGGVDPSIMGIGPVAATNKLFKRTGMKVEDLDLISELGKAFAAQSNAVARDLNFNSDILNKRRCYCPWSSGRASGCRILTTLLYEMQKRDAKKVLVTLCIGGGMGCATIVERLSS